jgi:hypothetical protein
MVFRMHLVEPRGRVVTIVRSKVTGNELDPDGFAGSQAPNYIEGLCVDVSKRLEANDVLVSFHQRRIPDCPFSDAVLPANWYMTDDPHGLSIVFCFLKLFVKPP